MNSSGLIFLLFDASKISSTNSSLLKFLFNDLPIAQYPHVSISGDNFCNLM